MLCWPTFFDAKKSSNNVSRVSYGILLRALPLAPSKAIRAEQGEKRTDWPGSPFSAAMIQLGGFGRLHTLTLHLMISSHGAAEQTTAASQRQAMRGRGGDFIDFRRLSSRLLLYRGGRDEREKEYDHKSFSPTSAERPPSPY